MVRHRLHRRLRGWLGRPLDWDDPGIGRFLSDKLVALEREKCRFCYLLCRAMNARRLLEVGTSFGVSTIYLAAAARDNGDEATVVGTEIDSSKAAAARANLKEAGLGDFADIRHGDLRDTLSHLAGPIDFVLMDVWAPLAGPAIEWIDPHLRSGSAIVCDNVRSARREYRDYLDFVGDPANRFRTVTLPFGGGLELSVKAAC